MEVDILMHSESLSRSVVFSHLSLCPFFSCALTHVDYIVGDGGGESVNLSM